jgi:hypothetical protein
MAGICVEITRSNIDEICWHLGTCLALLIPSTHVRLVSYLCDSATNENFEGIRKAARQMLNRVSSINLISNPFRWHPHPVILYEGSIRIGINYFAPKRASFPKPRFARSHVSIDEMQRKPWKP